MASITERVQQRLASASLAMRVADDVSNSAQQEDSTYLRDSSALQSDCLDRKMATSRPTVARCARENLAHHLREEAYKSAQSSLDLLKNLLSGIDGESLDTANENVAQSKSTPPTLYASESGAPNSPGSPVASTVATSDLPTSSKSYSILKTSSAPKRSYSHREQTPYYGDHLQKKPRLSTASAVPPRTVVRREITFPQDSHVFQKLTSLSYPISSILEFSGAPEVSSLIPLSPTTPQSDSLVIPRIQLNSAELRTPSPDQRNVIDCRLEPFESSSPTPSSPFTPSPYQGLNIIHNWLDAVQLPSPTLSAPGTPALYQPKSNVQT